MKTERRNVQNDLPLLRFEDCEFASEELQDCDSFYRRYKATNIPIFPKIETKRTRQNKYGENIKQFTNTQTVL